MFGVIVEICQVLVMSPGILGEGIVVLHCPPVENQYAEVE